MIEEGASFYQVYYCYRQGDRQANGWREQQKQAEAEVRDDMLFKNDAGMTVVQLRDGDKLLILVKDRLTDEMYEQLSQQIHGWADSGVKQLPVLLLDGDIKVAVARGNAVGKDAPVLSMHRNDEFAHSPMNIDYDPCGDTLTIDGTKYAGCFFRGGNTGFGGTVGQIFRIDQRTDDGTLTVTQLRRNEEDGAFEETI